MKKILLVVGQPVSGIHESGAELRDAVSPAARLDEVVMSTVRAAFARGISIVMPHDNVHAPLAAQVALEYATPRSAEQSPSQMPNDELPGPRVTYFEMHPSRGGARRRRVHEWQEIAASAGVAARNPLHLDGVVADGGLTSALLVGTGPVVTRTLSMLRARLPKVHVLSLRSCSSLRHDEGVHYIDDELGGALSSLRGRLRPVKLTESEERIGQETSPTFWVPYSLFLQRAIQSMAIGRNG